MATATPDVVARMGAAAIKVQTKVEDDFWLLASVSLIFDLI